MPGERQTPFDFFVSQFCGSVRFQVPPVLEKPATTAQKSTSHIFRMR
jgi:hypothetical protein